MKFSPQANKTLNQSITSLITHKKNRKAANEKLKLVGARGHTRKDMLLLDLTRNANPFKSDVAPAVKINPKCVIYRRQRVKPADNQIPGIRFMEDKSTREPARSAELIAWQRARVRGETIRHIHICRVLSRDDNLKFGEHFHFFGP